MLYLLIDKELNTIIDFSYEIRSLQLKEKVLINKSFAPINLDIIEVKEENKFTSKEYYQLVEVCKCDMRYPNKITEERIVANFPLNDYGKNLAKAVKNYLTIITVSTMSFRIDVIKKGDDHCKNCPYNRQTL